jgi:hypothetical protein
MVGSQNWIPCQGSGATSSSSFIFTSDVCAFWVLGRSVQSMSPVRQILFGGGGVCL